MLGDMKKQTATGICMMLLSALVTCVGQFLWKLSSAQSSVWLFLLGVCLYGVGAILMLLAFRNGEASLLHPMLSVGYIGSLVLGAVFLKEDISTQKLIGILLILCGLVLMVFGGTEKEKKK